MNELTRPNNDQNAGFTVLGQDGVRWVYGLPVLNHETKNKIEYCLFINRLSILAARSGYGSKIN